MKNLKTYLIEKQNFLIKNKNVLKDYDHYDYHPQTKNELKDIIMDLLKKGETDLNSIDVSKITDMSWLFSTVDAYITVENIDISDWDVSNVTDMSNMFDNCPEFNSDLSTWNVSGVKDMTSMFYSCTKFNSDLSKWNVSNVIQMEFMFLNCNELEKNNNIPDWYKTNI